MLIIELKVASMKTKFGTWFFVTNSHSELWDMQFVYGRPNGITTDARRLYVEAYLNRQNLAKIT